MLHIMLVTGRPQAMSPFIEALRSDAEVHLECFTSGADVLNAARTASAQLVVVDSLLPDEEPLGLVSKLIRVNAMVNTAVVSPLTEEEFHQASEGLGVLGRLPEKPGSGDASELMRKLRKLLGQC